MTASTAANVTEQERTSTGSTAALGANRGWNHQGAVSFTSSVLLLILVAVCFGQTVNGYFLGSDIAVVASLSLPEGVQGQGLAGLSLIGRAHAPLSITSASLSTVFRFEQVLFGADATGYFLCNLFLYAVAVLLLYFTVKVLTTAWSGTRSELSSFFSAALFAVAPLHCASVASAKGSGELLICLCYLAALCTWLKTRGRGSRWAVSGKIASALLALCTSSAASGLALLAFTISVLFPDLGLPAIEGGESGSILRGRVGLRSISSRVRNALKESLPLIAAAAVWIAFSLSRQKFQLSSPLSSFDAAMRHEGAGLFISGWNSAIQLGHFLLAPCSAITGTPSRVAEGLMVGTITALACFVCFRALASEISYRWPVFFAVWALSTTPLTWPPLQTGQADAGSFLLPSLALSSLLPVLALQLNNPHPVLRIERRFFMVAIALSSMLALLMVGVTRSLDGRIVAAGKEVRRIVRACEALAKSQPPGKKALLLGIPKARGGIAIIPDLDTLRLITAPPYAKGAVFASLLAQEPLSFGNGDWSTSTALRSELKDEHVSGAFVFNEGASTFKPYSLPAETSDEELTVAPESEQFSPKKFTRALASHIIPQLSFKARTKSAAIKWQRQLRSRLIAVLGGFPPKRCPLKAETTDTRRLVTYTDQGTAVVYRREKIVYYSQENLPVFGYFLTPVPGEMPGKKAPCVICLPGHGGMDDIVGVNRDGTLRKKWDGYQKDFALQTVAAGYPTLVLEQLGWGTRRGQYKPTWSNTECDQPTQAALFMGKTMIGWRTYDTIRALDYLATRKDVDTKRIAILGLSGGGTIALFTAALDDRVKCTIVSCYMSTFKDSIMSYRHCLCNIIPGIINVCEMSDIAGLVAPRQLFIQSAVHDRLFPFQSARQAFWDTRRIYGVLGRPDAVSQTAVDSEHTFNQQGIFEFLRKSL